MDSIPPRPPRIYRRQSDIERFRSKVRTTASCWLWEGGTSGAAGYGRFGVKRDGTWTTVGAHRFSYELHYGPVPEGLDVLHRCDEPRCVSPEHLFVGDARDNARDMFAKGRGHPGHVFGARHGCAKATTATVEEIRAAYKQGDKLKDIAARCGLSLSVVHAIATGRRWRHLDGAAPCLRRHAGGYRKLTWEQVRAIRARLAQSVLTASALRPVAQEYNVSVATLRLIMRGQIWKEDA